MSQPPKSTILAPAARWVSLRMVFLVMGRQLRIAGAHYRGNGAACLRPVPSALDDAADPFAERLFLRRVAETAPRDDLKQRVRQVQQDHLSIFAPARVVRPWRTAVGGFGPDAQRLLIPLELDRF